MTNASSIILLIAPAQAMLVVNRGRCHPRRERIFRNQLSQCTMEIYSLTTLFCNNLNWGDDPVRNTLQHIGDFLSGTLAH